MRIKQILRGIAWCEDDLIKNKERLSEKQKERIRKKSMEDIKKQDKRRYVNKRMKAIPLLVGISAIFIMGASYKLDVRQLFEKVFGSQAQHIAKSGEILQMSDSLSNVTVEVEGIVSDQYQLYMMLSIQKEEKFSKDSQIKFREISIQTQEEEEEIMGRVQTIKINPLEAYKNTKKLCLELSTYKDILGKEVEVYFTDLIEYAEKMHTGKIDTQRYLREQSRNELIKNLDSRNVEEVFIPPYLISNQNLGIRLYEDSLMTIESMGVIDDFLHIRVKQFEDTVYVMGEKQVLIPPVYQVREQDEGYFVYDLKDIIDIEKITFVMKEEVILNQVEGTWKFLFNTNDNSQIMYKNQVGEDEVVVSNISIIVNNNNLNRDKISIYFKEGEKLLIENNPVLSTNKQGAIKRVYLLEKPIDIQQIEHIEVNEKVYK